MHPRIQENVDAYFRYMGKFWGWTLIVLLPLVVTGYFLPKDDAYSDGKTATYLECRMRKYNLATDMTNYAKDQLAANELKAKYANKPDEMKSFANGSSDQFMKDPNCR